MDFKQRNAHKYIWLSLALGLPFLIFFSIENLDFSADFERDKLEANAESSTVRKSAENEWIQASLNSEGLELLLKKPIKSASSLVYELTEKGEKGNRLGQVSTAGVYSFPCSNSILGIVIFDKLKDTEISKLKF